MAMEPNFRVKQLMHKLKLPVCHDWDERKPTKLFTLIMVLDLTTRRILLGKKRRGLGEGKWNSFGGKFDPAIDSSIRGSAVRELQEECGLHCREDSVTEIGVLYFLYPTPPLFEVHLMTVSSTDCVGTASVSEEMCEVEWFPFELIPIGEMWADDEFWLPQLLSQKLFDDKSSATKLYHKFDALFEFETMEKVRQHVCEPPFGS